MRLHCLPNELDLENEITRFLKGLDLSATFAKTIFATLYQFFMKLHKINLGETKSLIPSFNTTVTGNRY